MSSYTFATQLLVSQIRIMALQPCSLAPVEVAQALRTHCADGLTPDEAARRLARRGPNRTPLVLPSPLRTFALGTLRCRVSTAFLIAGCALYTAWYPFERAAFTWAAMIIALALQGVVDFRSKRAVATLAQGSLQSQAVLVQRGGRAVTVPWHCVVYGDVLLLRAGQRVRECRFFAECV